jgi:hypothetical protein
MFRRHFGRQTDQEHEIRRPHIFAAMNIPEKTEAKLKAQKLNNTPVKTKKKADRGPLKTSTSVNDILTAERVKTGGLVNTNRTSIVSLSRKMNKSVLKRRSAKHQTFLSRWSPSQYDVIFRVGALSILNKGEIVYQTPRYHTQHHLYPLGFLSTRLFWSYKHPGTRTCYRFSIISQEQVDQLGTAVVEVEDLKDLYVVSKLERPVFTLHVLDDQKQVYISSHPQLLLSMVLNHFPEAMKRHAVRPRNEYDEIMVAGLYAGGFFGYGHHGVVPLLEKLPNAVLCQNYEFVNPELIRDLKRECAGVRSEEMKNQVELQLSLPVNPNGCIRLQPLPESGEWVKLPNTVPAVPLPFGERQSRYQLANGVEVVERERDQNIAFQTKFMQDFHRTHERNPNASGHTSRTLVNSPELLPLADQYRYMTLSVSRAIRVGYSRIHMWGLFARKPFGGGAMVIEYLGHAIRDPVSDLREKQYESMGCGSVYMFRLDQRWIVDATKKGNIARFINHSCDPNCYTKIVAINGQNKIIVFSHRPIALHEEITYNYFFASEEERINCKCGSINCCCSLN